MLPIFQHREFMQRFMLPVKKMVSIFQRSDTIRRRVKRRYGILRQIFFFSLMLLLVFVPFNWFSVLKLTCDTILSILCSFKAVVDMVLVFG